MCISKEVLDQKVATIREYKSIKKDAETNLKPLEQEVKEFMEETNQTSYIGYGYSISYKEQEKETVVKEKVLELLNNPKISKVIEAENIDTLQMCKQYQKEKPVLYIDGSKVRPLQPGDKMWDLYQKFDAYFKSMVM